MFLPTRRSRSTPSSGPNQSKETCHQVISPASAARSICSSDPIPSIRSWGYLGSSNLTLAGLSQQGELNVDVLDRDVCQKLARWFENRWNDQWCVDISGCRRNRVKAGVSEQVLQSMMNLGNMLEAMGEERRRPWNINGHRARSESLWRGAGDQRHTRDRADGLGEPRGRRQGRRNPW